MSPSRFWLAFAILFLLSIPMRLAWMHESVWLDEAWVANSVLEPTWGKMFRYESFVQSSPPLFLVLMRTAMSVAGPNEWSARLIPWIAATFACIVVTAALRRLVVPGAALAGAAFMLSNYWSINFAQQAKQYGTDMLAASIAIWLMTRWMEDEADRPPWLLAATACFAVATPWLSYPSLFLLPALILTVQPRWRVAAPVAVISMLSCAVSYAVAVLPARTPWMVDSLRRDMLDLHDPVGSFVRLAHNLGHLAIPQAFPGARVLALGLALAIVGGLIAAGRRRLTFLMIAVAPILTAVAASLLGLYPMANLIRMVVWLLPCVAVLVGAASDWLIGRLPWKAVFFLCAAIVIAGQWALTRFPHHGERNREAVSSIRAEFASGDCLFVQAGMAEQYKYYSARLEWTPPCHFTGRYSAPCCPTQWPADNRNPSLFHAELAAVRAQVRGKRLWMFLPEPMRGQWMGFFGPVLADVPARMAEDGCALEWERGFDRTKVQRYRCSP